MGSRLDGKPISSYEGSWAQKQVEKRGERAADQGVPYEDNPYTIKSERIAWSVGHNRARARNLQARHQARL